MYEMHNVRIHVNDNEGINDYLSSVSAMRHCMKVCVVYSVYSGCTV